MIWLNWQVDRDSQWVHLRRPAKLNTVGIVVGALIAFGAFTLGWRWASRRWSLPCPSLLAWSLDNSLVRRSPLTLKTLDRIGFNPGEKVLEIGPGPGRLLIPAAKRVMPGGEVVGIDIQPKMIERLKRNAEKAGITNRELPEADISCFPLPWIRDLLFPVDTSGHSDQRLSGGPLVAFDPDRDCNQALRRRRSVLR